MKVILFLAAIYALIYNQSQHKKKLPVPPHKANSSYTQSVSTDTAKKAPAMPALYYANYLNAQPSMMRTVPR